MWYPFSQYPAPTGSFKLAMDAPIEEPDEGRIVCASWNDTYTPYITGALQQLMLQSTWKFRLGASYNQTFGRMQEVINRIGNASDCSPRVRAQNVTYDFRTSSFPGTIAPAGHGQWVNGEGWTGTWVDEGGGYSFRLTLNVGGFVGFLSGALFSMYEAFNLIVARKVMQMSVAANDTITGTSSAGYQYTNSGQGVTLNYGMGGVMTSNLNAPLLLELNWYPFPFPQGDLFYVREVTLNYFVFPQ